MLKLLINQRAVMGLARHALTTLGGFLVANGYLDAEMAEQMQGAMMVLVGVVWSVMDKRDLI